MTTNGRPLVTVGLPTYNRVSSLKRAIESVLAQDYTNIELVISDNASIDGTKRLCEEICEQDTRVRYIRQPRNLGAHYNFIEVLRQARGQFFMWLGDDDWLGRSYVSRCVGTMMDQPEFALVSGTAQYFRDGKFALAGEIFDLTQDSAEERIVAYYRQVIRNGVFYGLMRREHVSAIEMPRALGGDWLFIAAVAFGGKVKTLADVSVNRSLDGASATMESTARAGGLPWWHGKIPNVSIAMSVFKHIGWREPAYQSLGRLSRISLALRAVAIFFGKYYVPYWRYRVRFTRTLFAHGLKALLRKLHSRPNRL